MELFITFKIERKDSAHDNRSNVGTTLERELQIKNSLWKQNWSVNDL